MKNQKQQTITKMSVKFDQQIKRARRDGYDMNQAKKTLKKL